MRRRHSARLLVVSPARRVLLFRFVHKDGPLAGDDYWATPGGGVEAGETFEAAAIQELQEETGICVDALGEPVADREASLRLPDGEYVMAVERYFLIETNDETLSTAKWTIHERNVMADYRWWSETALEQTTATIWPEGLVAMLRTARGFG
jgi:8-oxo-dGTP pyrophosphatase MutT (NUDIX family)